MIKQTKKIIIIEFIKGTASWDDSSHFRGGPNNSEFISQFFL